MNYDDEVKQARNGLLPRLTPGTLVKVANQSKAADEGAGLMPHVAMHPVPT